MKHTETDYKTHLSPTMQYIMNQMRAISVVCIGHTDVLALRVLEELAESIVGGGVPSVDCGELQ